MSSDVEKYGMCWRSAGCIKTSVHGGECEIKPYTVQCGFNNPMLGERCELTEGHEARHQARTDTWQWKAIDGVEHPYSLKAVTEVVHDKYLAKVTPETKFIKDPIRKIAEPPKRCYSRSRLTHRKGERVQCEKTIGHDGWHENENLSWPYMGTDTTEPHCDHFDCACPTNSEGVPQYPAKPTWDKNARRRSELKKLNAAASRLSSLAEKRLARIKELEAENARLTGELEIVKQERERDAYHKLCCI